MIINEKIRDEKLQYDIKKAAAKISAISSGKRDKYEYLTGKAIEKQSKTIKMMMKDQLQSQNL